MVYSFVPPSPALRATAASPLFRVATFASAFCMVAVTFPEVKAFIVLAFAIEIPPASLAVNALSH